MKKKAIIIISSIIILLAILSACSKNLQGTTPTDTSTTTDAQSTEQSKIKELEIQILTLLQNQQISEAERKKEIEQLTEELEKLKNQETQKPVSTETQAPQNFKYILENGKATITEITAAEESITIPSSIDGYQVYSIGSEALSSNSVKSVIISDGIEKLDWFAFRGCVSLSSVSIPNSISSIGYGAFDNTSKSLTIVCSRDSFAHKYAQSYGITYDIS